MARKSHIFSIRIPPEYRDYLTNLNGSYGEIAALFRLAVMSKAPEITPVELGKAILRLKGPFSGQVNFSAKTDQMNRHVLNVLEAKAQELGVHPATLGRVVLCLYLDELREGEDQHG